MINKIARTATIVLLISLFSNISHAQTNFAALSNDHEIVAKYEHGGKGYAAISQDSVGYSYGKWQVSTKRGNTHKSTFDLFMSYLKERDSRYYNDLEEAGGYDNAYLGTENFKNAWQKAAKEQRFQRLYDEFILETQIKPAYRKFDTNEKLNVITTWGSTNIVVQAALHSIIIQHGIGGAYRMLNNLTANYEPSSPEDFLHKLYAYRIEKFYKYKSRYEREYADLKVALTNMRG